MGFVDILILVLSLVALFAAGLKFLQRSMYRDFQNRNPAAKILFALMFALSASMLELLVFEVIGFMNSGYGLFFLVHFPRFCCSFRTCMQSPLYIRPPPITTHPRPPHIRAEHGVLSGDSTCLAFSSSYWV